jgi:hypothetical protein
MKIKGNLCVQERFGGKLYLYTAEFGHLTFGVLKAALEAGRKHWGDEQFLTRVIFCSFLKPDDLTKTTSYGISTFLGENELPVFVIDVANRRVLMEEGAMFVTCPCVGFSWGFEDFLKLTDDPRVAYLEGVLNESKAK